MIPKIMLIALCLIAVVSISPIYAQTPSIPEWIKNTAEFWVKGDLSDAEFLGALQFLVEEGMLEIPSDEITKDIESEYSGESFNVNYLRSHSADFVWVRTYDHSKGLEIRVMFQDGETPDTAKFVAVDSYAKIKVVDESENILYSGTLKILEEDFSWYYIPLEDEHSLEYRYMIPINEIKPSSSMYGMVYLDAHAKNASWEGAWAGSFMPTYEGTRPTTLL